MSKRILLYCLFSTICVWGYSQIETKDLSPATQYNSKLLIPDPPVSFNIVSENYPGFREKLLDLRIQGTQNSFILLRNNTDSEVSFEPTIHSSTGADDKFGLIITANIGKSADTYDDPIMRIAPFVDNGLGYENGGYDYPINRHYFQIVGVKSGEEAKYLFEIDQNGNIGIGTKSPKAKLEVTDGDIYLSDISKGIIMKSPDGNCWRGVLNNSGVLEFTSFTCPL